MATVHPSRLGLVPQAAPSRQAPPPPVSREDELRQRLLDRKRQDGRGDSRGSDHNDRPRDYDSRDESRGDDVRRSGRDHRDGRGGEGRRRAEDGEESGRGDRRRRTSRSPQRHERDPAYRSEGRDDRSGRDDRPNDSFRGDDRSRRDDQDQRSRRASPSYNAYTAPRPHGNGAGPGYGPGAGGLGQSAPWQDIRNGMPPFPPRGPPRGGSGGGGWNGPMDLERRRQERDNMTLTVWPPSPKEPFRDDEELAADRKAAKKKSKKSKSKSKRRSKYSSDSDSTDSEEERRRRKRKERRRERKSKKYSDSESESDDGERRKRRRKSSEKRSRTEERDEEDQWVEKGGEVALKPKSIETARVVPVAAPPPLDDSDEEVGPQLPVDHSARDRTHRSAYANMGRGEGEAMAAFVASGERIPRRGEIGMEAEVIDKFEKSGYVMSGSRHQRMNAVRMRKENQVINAEEKRAILKLQREEKDKKEGAIVAQFREMLQDNLAKQAGKG